MKRTWGELATAAFFGAVGVLIAIMSFRIRQVQVDDPLGPRFLPLVAAALLIGSSLWLMLQWLWMQRTQSSSIDENSERAQRSSETAVDEDGDGHEPDEAEQAAETGGNRRGAAIIGIVAFAYYLLLPILSYEIATPLALIAGLYLLGDRNPVRLVAVPAVTTVALVGIFSTFFGVRLP